MTRYALGLGSNLGDRRQHLVDAVRRLAAVGELAVSPIYETEPVGGPDQGPFLNAVVVLDSDLDAEEILELCQAVEESHGRQREQRWGPRTLDLDIIATDGPPYRSERLTIPHPRAAEREFVLRPLSDVWPEAPVGEDVTASQALQDVSGQGVDYLASDWVPPVSRWKANALLAGQFGIFLAVASTLAYDGRIPEGGVAPARIGGGVVALAGATLALVAVRRLGTSMAASPIPRAGGELVIVGPYRYARHPIYGGLCLFFMGSALAFGSLLGLLVAATLVPYFLLKARYEERQLRIRYAGYRAYMQAVRRRLIPFVV